MSTVALVAPHDAGRGQLADYLRAGGFSVSECVRLDAPAKFDAVVVIDDGTAAVEVSVVQAWLKGRTPHRVVVVTPRPAGWKALAFSHSTRLTVLAAPSFAWQIVDALRLSGAS